MLHWSPTLVNYIFSSSWGFGIFLFLIKTCSKFVFSRTDCFSLTKKVLKFSVIKSCLLLQSFDLFDDILMLDINLKIWCFPWDVAAVDYLPSSHPVPNTFCSTNPYPPSFPTPTILLCAVPSFFFMAAPYQCLLFNLSTIPPLLKQLYISDFTCKPPNLY